jgi:hypothetical protein
MANGVKVREWNQRMKCKSPDGSGNLLGTLELGPFPLA